MDTSEIKQQLNEARDAIRTAVQRYHEATGLPIIGNFEAYKHSDGRVDYRIKADSQVIFEANGSLDVPAMRVRVVEMYLASMSRVGRVDMPDKDVPMLVHELEQSFEHWRRNPTRGTYETFCKWAAGLGVHASPD